MSRASHQARINATISVKQIQQSSEVFRVYTTICSYTNNSPQEIEQVFGFWAHQGLKLYINLCLRGFNAPLSSSLSLIYGFIDDENKEIPKQKILQALLI